VLVGGSGGGGGGDDDDEPGGEHEQSDHDIYLLLLRVSASLPTVHCEIKRPINYFYAVRRRETWTVLCTIF
jgi:hypothetical protein